MGKIYEPWPDWPLIRQWAFSRDRRCVMCKKATPLKPVFSRILEKPRQTVCRWMDNRVHNLLIPAHCSPITDRQNFDEQRLIGTDQLVSRVSLTFSPSTPRARRSRRHWANRSIKTICFSYLFFYLRVIFGWRKVFGILVVSLLVLRVLSSCCHTRLNF